jgi:apolipoprotein N-acyltransferase
MLNSLGVWGLQTAVSLGLGLLVGLPWHDQRWLPAGLLAMSILLVMIGQLKTWRAVWLTIVWSASANGLAFYWAPAMFSLGLQLEPWKGDLLYLPLLFLDMLRAGLPILIATRSFAQSRHQWFWAACIAITVENLITSMFPWRMGYSQLGYPWLNQSADLLGPDVATFLFYAHVGVLALLWEWVQDKVLSTRSPREYPDSSAGALSITGPRARHTRNLFGRLAKSSALSVTLLNGLYSTVAYWSWSGITDEAPTLRVALIQISPLAPNMNERFRRESNRLSGQVDLICWPECCAGSYETNLKSLRDPAEIEKKSREPDRGLRPWPEPHCPLLVGGKIYRGHPRNPKKLYQAALLLDKQETIADRYYKRYLMPIGEYKPMDRYWPGMSRTLGFTELIDAGEKANPLAVNGQKMGVVLCYEDMVPQATRTLTQNGANLLVSLINGAAFFNPLILDQHRLLAQQRAIECRRYHVRCATTGETCVISPLGEIVARLPKQTEETLVAEVKLLDTSSWYASDDWRSWPGTAFPWIMGSLVILRMCIDQRRAYYARIAQIDKTIVPVVTD